MNQPDSPQTIWPSRDRKSAGIFPGLQSLEEFQAENQKFFPSIASLRWALRKNRTQLAEAGAIALIAGRIYIDCEVFESLMLRLGKEQVQKL